MLEFFISGKWVNRQVEHPGGPIEFGRGPGRGDVPRQVLDDPGVAADHLRVVELGDGRIRVENLCPRTPIVFQDNTSMAPGGHRELKLPVILTVGETRIDIEPHGGGDEEAILRDSWTALAPSIGSGDEPEGPTSLRDLGPAPPSETLARWFERVIRVQQAASGSAAFYEQTARALVDLIGLDQGQVLLLRAGRWTVEACWVDPKVGGEARPFSHRILERVARDRRTSFQQLPAQAVTTGSLEAVEAVVAAPIFDARRDVVGALYGIRHRGATPRSIGIGPLEAQVVHLLAAAVGTGLARLESEAEAARRRVQFEQFFSADLARALESDPKVLEGQDREVTVMFADIRGFSRLSERLGPRQTCRLTADVMDLLTARIRHCAGVVVDYMGDGLMAIWNAPLDQPDHAALACRAALAILEELPGASAAWSGAVGGPLGLGIGLNTGPVIVGNTGSRHKFKYGPLGHTVNLASRVEGATKFFGVPALITGATRERLGDGFATRRLSRVRVVGIAGAVDLYELHAGAGVPDWPGRRDAYERALACYEAGQWAAACRTLHPLLEGQEGRYDVPSLHLISRAVQCLKSPPPEPFDPVLELSSK